jgi:hypothetical protein
MHMITQVPTVKFPYQSTYGLAVRCDSLLTFDELYLFEYNLITLLERMVIVCLNALLPDLCPSVL